MKLKKMITASFKMLLLFLSVWINVLSGHAQQSNDKAENENIGRFIQVWGLVKYRSQQSIAGQFDADKEFLGLIDSVKKADKKQFNQLMIKMTKDIGPEPTVSKQVYPKNKLINGPYLLKNVNYSWIRNKYFSKPLRTQLRDLTNQINNSGKHHYLPAVWYEGDLPNEHTYADYAFGSEAMNLLTLAKTWNAIEYLFPYKYVTDKNWDKVLMEMIPIFKKIHDRTSYEKAVLMLATATNDTHAAAFMGTENMKMAKTIFNVRYYPPFDYQARENSMIIKQFLNDSLAKKSELKIGDELVAINGINIKRWLRDRSFLLPSSNEAVKYRALSTTNNNRGDALAFSDLQDSILEVKVNRQGALLDLDLEMLDLKDIENTKLIAQHIKQERSNYLSIPGLENIGSDITLIRAGHFFDKDLPEDEDLQELSAELKSKKAIIFDMRNYPQSPGFFSYYLPKLLGKAPFAFARYYTADPRQVGIFKYREELETYMVVPKSGSRPIGDLYTGQLVILTNENTQSMGEWFTMMLRQLNNNTTVIGSQTAGADGDVRRLTLPGDYQFSFTGNGIFYPDGRETQRIGIIPDIYFEPSVKDLSGTEDAQLQRALRYIREGK